MTYRNKIKLVIVEDDFSYEEVLVAQLEEEFPRAQFRSIGTEAEFRRKADYLISYRPTAVVMDLMLSWESPKPNPEERPEDVKREGLTRAGFRCQQILDEKANGSKIPLVLYSALPASEIQETLDKLPSHVTFLPKDQIDKLPEKIKELAELK